MGCFMTNSINFGSPSLPNPHLGHTFLWLSPRDARKTIDYIPSRLVTPTQEYNTVSKEINVRDLNEVLANTQLPALPTSAMKLLELSQDPKNGPAEYAKPIEADAGLMGQVLRFVNSSYFGFSREIASIQQALTLVGVRTIKNFALWSAVFSLVPNPKFGPFDLKCLWQDSLRRAVFARSLGRELKVANSEDLFAAALLQDMAIPLLLKALPEQYEALVNRRTNEKLRLSSLEKELLPQLATARGVCRADRTAPSLGRIARWPFAKN
jgi:hypothetical protein